MTRLARAPQTVRFAAVPAVPGTPARPARTGWNDPAPFVGLFFIGLADAKVVTKPDGTVIYDIGWARLTGTIVYRNSANVALANGTIATQYTTPAQPAVPGSPAIDAQTVTVGAKGWAAGGRTIARLQGAGEFRFKFVRAVAALAGLASPGTSYGFAVPKFAWYRHDSVVEVVESGKTVYTQPAPSGDPEYAIVRTRGRIEYRIDGATVYTSTAVSTGDLVGYGTPYAVGDVVDAEVADHTGIAATIPAVAARFGSFSDRIATTLPAITAHVESINAGGMQTSVPAATGRLGTWSGIQGALGAIEADVRGEPSHIVNGLYAELPGITSVMGGIQGTFGGIAADVPAARGRLLQGTHVGRIATALPAAQSAIVGPSLGWHLPEVLGVSDFTAFETAILLVSMDGLDVSDGATLTLILELATADGLTLSDSTGLGAIAELVTHEVVRINNTLALSQREALQYAVNIATGALSVYSGFDFSGFIRLGGETFGWRTDGLYRIGAPTDNGALIQALIDYGASDLGSAQAKRIAMAWIGVRTDGGVYLRVQADSGSEYVYRATAAQDTHRAQLGKGLTGRQWNLKLEIEDASYASVDSIELDVGVTQRRFNAR